MVGKIIFSPIHLLNKSVPYHLLQNAERMKECRVEHVCDLSVQENDGGSLPAAAQPLPQPHVTAVSSSLSAPVLGAKPKSGVGL